MTQSFNAVLLDGVKNLDITLIDVYAFDINLNHHYESFGLTNITTPACDLSLLPNSSSLFCSSATLISSGADKTYKYADAVHPTSGYSKIIGDFIFEQLEHPSQPAPKGN